DVHLLATIATESLRGHRARDEWMLSSVAMPVIGAAERIAKGEPIGDLEEPLRALATELSGFREYSVGAVAKQRARLLALVARPNGRGPVELISSRAAWRRVWRDRSATMTPAQRALLPQLGLVTSVAPTKAWRTRTT